MTKNALVVPLVLAMLLAACGGGGGSSTDPAATDNGASGGTSAPAPAPSPSTAPAPASASAAVLASVNTTARGVAVLTTGTRIAGWSDDAGVHAQQFDAQGTLVGGATAIAPSGTFAGIAALSGGGYAIEYNLTDAVLVQPVSATGALTGAPTVVRTQAQVEADLAGNMNPELVGGAGVYALGDGGFAAEYRARHLARVPGDYPGDLWAQRYDASGSPLGIRTHLASEMDIPRGLATTASTPAGGLVLGMTELCPCVAGGIALVQVLDQNLQASGTLTSALYESTGYQNAAGLANGNYIAVWSTLPGSPTGTTEWGPVKGQLFGSGDRNAVVTFANAGPGARVTALAGGGFLLSWGTSAQAFDANAQAVGGLMQILEGSIAATPDGGFVVVAQLGGQLVEQQYAVPE